MDFTKAIFLYIIEWARFASARPLSPKTASKVYGLRGCSGYVEDKNGL